MRTIVWEMWATSTGPTMPREGTEPWNLVLSERATMQELAMSETWQVAKVSRPSHQTPGHGLA